MNIALTPLFEAQAQLDAHIQSQHGVDYVSTRKKRLLALLVEVGELINETRTFKFWSKKGPSEAAVILDEYADGIHFLLSLGLDLGSQKRDYEITSPTHDLVEQTLVVYAAIHALTENPTAKTLEAAFQAYLNMIPLLGFDDQRVIAGYFQKLGINYTRQQTHY